MKKTLAAILILMLSTTMLSAATIETDFIPPEYVKYMKSLHLRLDIIGGSDEIEEVYLFYKKANLDYVQVLMDPGVGMNPYYDATIPGSYIDQPISFYFRIIKKDMLEQTIPGIDPINNPYYVPMKKPAETQKKADTSFQMLSPDQDYNYQDDDFMVAISYFTLEDKLQGKNIKLFFDGKDVSTQATITSNLLVYKPASVKPTTHKIEIIVYNADGSVFKQKNWVVKVQKVPVIQKLPVSVNGDLLIDSRLTMYNADSSSYYHDADNEFRSIGRLRLWGGKNWFRYKGKVYISSEERSTRQPYNRYSLDFYVPHFNLYLGDHNQIFSNSTIAGKNIRGVGGDLQFGFFKLSSFYGQIQRHIKGTMVLDTIDTAVDTSFTGGYYNRNSLGVRMQFGKERGFYLSLNALKTKDDMKSEEFAQNPKDNIVVGVDSKLSLFKSRVQLGWEVSASLLNNNIAPGVMTKEDMDSLDINLPFDPESLENIFIINQFVEPYKLTMSNIAAEGYLRTFFMHNLLNIRYSYVGGSFHSLANPYLQSDKAGFNIMDNVTLLNNQLTFGLGYHAYNDNIRDTKGSTTYTKGLLVNAGYFPYQKVPSLAFNFQQTKITNEISDTTLLPINRLNNIATINTSYKLPIRIFSPTATRFQLSYSFTNTSDKEYESYNYNTNNVRLGVKVNYTDIPISTSLSFGYLARKDTPIGSPETKSNYITVGVTEELRPKVYKDGSFRTTVGYNLTQSTGDVRYMKHYISCGVYNQLKILPSDTFLSLELAYLIYQDKDNEANDYNQMRGILKLTQKF
ncbi:MAG TPA: hypothetical protein ENL10_04190 [Candidatus Cloacimonetes bacterium]|nr:hypothetical protein [Candidatus Cloacimonadota bacterium]